MMVMSIIDLCFKIDKDKEAWLTITESKTLLPYSKLLKKKKKRGRTRGDVKGALGARE